jgi:hypothetical protein
LHMHYIYNKKRCSNGTATTSVRFGRTESNRRRPSRRCLTIRFPSTNRTLRGTSLVYYGETNTGRLLAVIVAERYDDLRVVTAYDLDAGQRRDYLRRRAL